MNDRRPALGRGLGALIPTSADGEHRPSDVFFGRNPKRPGEGDETDVTDARVDGDHIADGRHEEAGHLATGHHIDNAVHVGDGSWATEGPDIAGGPHVDAGHDAGHDHGHHAGDGPQRVNGRHLGAEGSDNPGSGTGPRWDGEERTESGPKADTPGLGLRPVPGLTFAELPIAAIRPNPRQPRMVFDDDELAELVSSIRQIGILQPVVVRSLELSPGSEADDDDSVRFELVVGERRWRAAALAGLDHLPAIIKATADDEMLRDALLENLHRSQLNPLEEAAAYQQLLEDFGCTQDDLANRIGRSRPQVSNTLRLLKLPALVQRRVAAGVLSAGHARALLGLADAAAMERLAQRIVAEGLSVRSVEEIVALGLHSDPVPRRSPRHAEPDPQLEDLAARMADVFDTRVHVSLGRRKGRVTIDFASVEDLRRILAKMGVDTPL